MGRMCGALATALAVLGLAAPATASAAWATSVSMYSDPGDFIGDGRQRVWHAGNATEIAGKTERDELLTWAVGGGESYGFQFAAPRGQALEPRNYLLAQRVPFRKDDHPGLSVNGMSRGCNEVDGRFELLDLALSPAGEVERMWAIYEQHCEGDFPAAWGEIRINAWVPEEQAAVAPGIVRWPEHDAWETATPVPVAYTGGAAVREVSVVGAHAGDFAVLEDGCTGRVGPCEVKVRFAPAGGGTRTAGLRFTDAGGRVHEARLEGFAHGGTTQARFEVLEGDVAGQPGTYEYASPASRFNGGASFGRAGLWTSGDEQNRNWFVQLYAGPGRALTTGEYDGAADIYSGSGPGIEVSGTPSVCNKSAGSYTVHEISHMPEGSLRTLDVSFEMRCYEDKREALRGRWRYRAGSAEPIAPWLEPGARPRIDAPPRPGTAPPPGGGGAPPGGGTLPGGTGGGDGGAGATLLSTAVAPLLRADARVLGASCPAAAERAGRLLQGAARADRLLGRPGADLVLAGPGRDTVFGRGGADCVAGGAGADRLFGGPGDDTLLGQGGNDLLVGGAGRDLLVCGAGRRDRAIAGRGDRVRGCERVRRRRG